MSRSAGGPSPAHARKALHIAMGSLALLLRYLSWRQAAALAASAIAFNAFVLPRLTGDRLHRDHDRRRGYAPGILLYPLSVLGLILCFPSRPDIAAAAWGIMAAGDGMAGLVGEAAGTVRVPWNPRKSLAGSAAFVVFGALTGSGLAWWCRPALVPPPYLWFTIAVPIVAAVAAAAVETLPIGLDDNVSVPAAAAAVLWAGSYVSPDLAAEALAQALQRLPAGLLLNAGAAVLAWRARSVSVSGAVAGTILGVIIFCTTAWAGWFLLMATFGAAAVTSRMGWRRKVLLGIEEARGGRRGAGNAIANTGVAAAAAVLGVTSYFGGTAFVACAAALAAGGSDTVASEIGKAWGRRTVLPPSFRAVPPGTPGALSLEGTAAGVGGAVVLAAVAAAAGLTGAADVPVVVAGATAGSLAESLLGATLEPRGILDNDVLNFLNTAIAAGVAAFLVAAL
jgi:uncharacterized protein (TIGR00297 family)